jgi:hypothetical protein
MSTINSGATVVGLKELRQKNKLITLTVSSSWNLSKPLIKTVLSAPGLGFGVKPLFSLCHRKFDNLTVSYLYMKILPL